MGNKSGRVKGRRFLSSRKESERPAVTRATDRQRTSGPLGRYIPTVLRRLSESGTHISYPATPPEGVLSLTLLTSQFVQSTFLLNYTYHFPLDLPQVSSVIMDYS